jgi:hypothetical protein
MARRREGVRIRQGNTDFVVAPDPNLEVIREVAKGRVYLQPGEDAPAGHAVQVGPRGGHYVEVGARDKLRIQREREKRGRETHHSAKTPQDRPPVAAETGSAGGRDDIEDIERAMTRLAARLALDSKEHLRRNRAWYATLTKEQKHAISEYLDMFAFTQINGYLRLDATLDQGAEALVDIDEPAMRKIIRNLDSVVANAPPSPPTLWRGVVDDDGWFSAMQEGEEFSDPAFLSTSISKDAAAGFAGESGGHMERGILLKISIPHGVRAAYIDSMRSDGKYDAELDWMMRTNEYLLPRGQMFRIVSRLGKDDDWGVPVMEVELVAA